MLLLAGIAKQAHEVVVNHETCGGDDKMTVALLEGLVPGDRLDSQARSVCAHLDLAGSKPKLVPKSLRNDQAPCLVNGCPHALRIPSKWSQVQRLPEPHRLRQVEAR